MRFFTAKMVHRFIEIKNQSSRIKSKCYEKGASGNHVSVGVEFFPYREARPAQKAFKTHRPSCLCEDQCIQNLCLANLRQFDKARVLCRSNFAFRIKAIGWEKSMAYSCINSVVVWLNENAKRAHLTNKIVFYKILEYESDGERGQKLVQWGNYYNLYGQYPSHTGKSPYVRFKCGG
jgi:hypothetical protein